MSSSLLLNLRVSPYLYSDPMELWIEGVSDHRPCGFPLAAKEHKGRTNRLLARKFMHILG